MTQLRKQISAPRSVFLLVCTNKPPPVSSPLPSGAAEEAVTRVTLRIINPPFQLLPPDALPPDKAAAKLAGLRAGTFPLRRLLGGAAPAPGVGGTVWGAGVPPHVCPDQSTVTDRGREVGTVGGAGTLSQNHLLPGVGGGASQEARGNCGCGRRSACPPRQPLGPSFSEGDPGRPESIRTLSKDKCLLRTVSS